MLTARHKIKKSRGKDNKAKEPTRLEHDVAKALYELQLNSEKLKESVRELVICAAKEIDITADKKAILIFVPVPQLAKYQKLIKERSLIEELEKKFSGKSVFIIAQRRIIRKETRNTVALKQKRPRSRTLTAVHEAILDDIVFPNEITGKRIRYRHDGSRLLRVFLHQEIHDSDKIATYSTVYNKLTGKNVVFEVQRN
ncbi:ribosomal protein S7 [Salpingoeca rosetta]|uniref:40S ribosomal protein S7 n=1 Tax=Salpingoeca rosetta (strain ATCC 50818 / BSB-021) TaxID=946362 RepID=F2TXI7_SALR5|nr:ribosomal protein S7 [Salpingoeca rosetta]EGD76096.1 ribosomal protein S7 [Salpingoeca rosetta]|eukprot:XP_004998271.1 ribosomal protein S7 [Salpingoeca rosetta]